jgi:hypothetical protein
MEKKPGFVPGFFVCLQMPVACSALTHHHVEAARRTIKCLAASWIATARDWKAANLRAGDLRRIATTGLLRQMMMVMFRGGLGRDGDNQYRESKSESFHTEPRFWVCRRDGNASRHDLIH